MTILRFNYPSRLKSTQKFQGQEKDIVSFSAGGEFTLIDGENHDGFVIKVISCRAAVLGKCWRIKVLYH